MAGGDDLCLETEREHETVTHGVTGDNFISLIPFQVLSWEPRAVYYPNFATVEQCPQIINMAKPFMQPSKVVLRPGKTVKNSRTSYGSFVNASKDASGVLDIIEEKIARVTMIPKNHGESFNVLRYEIGQKYAPCYDTIDPAKYGPQTNKRARPIKPTKRMLKKAEKLCFPTSGLNMDGRYNYQDSRFESKATQRRWTSVLFLVPKCYRFTGTVL